MKNIKFSLFIILGLFIFNPLSGQEITSYSGVFYRILGYPSSSSGVTPSYYGQFRFTFTNPEIIAKVRFRYIHANGTAVPSAEYEEFFQFKTENGKILYESGGVWREVKHSGIILDMDLTDVFHGDWEDADNRLSISVYDHNGGSVDFQGINFCEFETLD